jgi:hypothetical protein
VAYAASVFNEPPSLIGWSLLVLGCFVLGAVILAVAAGVLILAGCKIKWPGDPASPPPHEPAP